MFQLINIDARAACGFHERNCVDKVLIIKANLFDKVLYMLKNERQASCHLLLFFTSYVLNMFRTLEYPSSGACNSVVELPHRSSCSQFVVCWRFGVAGFEYCSCCRLDLFNASVLLRRMLLLVVRINMSEL